MAQHPPGAVSGDLHLAMCGCSNTNSYPLLNAYCEPDPFFSSSQQS